MFPERVFLEGLLLASLAEELGVPDKRQRP